MVGAANILSSELKNNNIKIARVSGASAGSWAAMFLLIGVSTSLWMETYYILQENSNKHILDVYESIYDWFISFIPDDAYITCSQRLFISISIPTLYGFKNQIISTYHSNYDLFQCCMASSAIPNLTTSNRLYWKLRGEYAMDGGITNNTPIFTDGVNRQLVFRLFDVEYPWRLLY